MPQKNPKVSISARVYNQGKFIAQAIESVLMQQVNFDYEFIAGEDCSQDNSRAILIDYQKRYPDKIRLLLPERNIGRHNNFIQTLHASRGQYIALLDGDDYWTSPQKLQKQVDFLDNNPQCALCFHNVNLVYESNRESHPYHQEKLNSILTLKDLLHRNFMPTSSVMVRNNLVREFPQWFYSVTFCDWPFFLLSAQHGDIGYLDEIMGVYRIHSGGVWARSYERVGEGRIKHYQADLQFFKVINEHFGYKYDVLLTQEVQRRHVLIRKESFKLRMATLFPTVYDMFRRLKYGRA
ncbi:glycosyltransferase [Candidatus Omnitrophota bacterium]